jgi:hypothetical protein
MNKSILQAIPALELEGSKATLFTPRSSTWVKLRELPSDYSFDEALLLCEESDGGWVAWVPSFGEIILTRADFYNLAA